MKVATAKICGECDEIYQGDVCPACTSKSNVSVSTFISPMKSFKDIREERNKNEVEKRFFQIPTKSLDDGIQQKPCHNHLDIVSLRDDVDIHQTIPPLPPWFTTNVKIVGLPNNPDSDQAINECKPDDERRDL